MSRIPVDAVDLILASASPRRRELLERLGLRLRVLPADIDETPLINEPPRTYVRRVAHEKCLAVFAQAPDQADQSDQGLPVLAADTTVIVNETILAKPANAHEATAMLQRLAGRQHEVVTAFCIGFQGQIVQRLISTQVQFRALDSAEVKAYVDSGEWEGKAGGYAIQDKAAAFVTEVQGSITNVIGLPLAEVLTELRALGALPAYPPAGFGAAT